VRYSFHGKVRSSGQQVDGFVEAANATEAIDRLADRGIIGVYSVRPESKPTKNAIILSGEASPDEAEHSQQSRKFKSPAIVPRRLPAAPAQDHAPALQPASAPAASSPGAEAALLQLVDKLTALMGRVEQALSRPMNVVYQAGPARNAAGGGAIRGKSKGIPQDMQSSTLHDIFQNNLDLRKSLDKLASTVGPPPAKPAPAPLLAPAESPAREAAPARESLREAPKPPREPAAHGPKLAVQAQPA